MKTKEELQKEKKELLDLLYDCYTKHCRFDDGFDHMCDGTYRIVQKVLIEHGLVGDTECVRD